MARLQLLALAVSALLLVAEPVHGSRKLLDLQDLHPVEPGQIPADEAIASTEEAFNRDMGATQTSMAIENDLPATVAVTPADVSAETAETSADSSVAAASESAAVADASSVPVSTAAAADTTTGDSIPVGTMGDDAVASQAMDEDEFGWEDWDQPDADTWFYNGDEGMEEQQAGWTWDDPLDLEGDNAWDTEWTPPVRDETIEGRYNATMAAVTAHVAPNMQGTAVAAKAVIRAGVSEVLSIEDHPKNNLLLEVLTILPLLPPVLLVFFLMRAASQTLTMYHLVQFACFFCAGYSGLLITAAMLTGDDPLAAFQFMAGHGAYIKYQFLVAAAYSLFLVLLYINVCVQRCGTTALIQQVMGTTIGLHYYLGTFHPAMIALPPESVVGISTGMSTYMFYMIAFFLMGIVPPRQKDLGEEEEDDKTLGEGKGQD
eukprot:CAMPEP_0114244952 /NCGR_PEP_ID=MMETSP0058-20121206/11622_1 /TAXON_ID=36894 /ORGANISM="Pyramimonas parkeae, CCMP726" /LENGTH=430 /DNA_ID=CAMNT_0001357943 /DNA_START=105 /DNA_END=1397 /DNA_ORIENTATION=+